MPVYVLMGEESYFIDVISNYLANTVLTDDEKEFNQTVIYGKDASYEMLISTVRSYPMMASRRVVILKEAQTFRELEKLEAYFRKPVDTTILVICHKYSSIDKRKKVYKEITSNKNILLFESKRLDENQTVDWIRMYSKQRNITIDPGAGYALLELLGDDLSRIAREIEKFTAALPEGSMIKLEQVTSSVGMSREYNTFELQSALASRNSVHAAKIVNYFVKHPNTNPIQMVIGILYGFFSKVLVAKANNCRNESELNQKFRIYMRAPDLSNAVKNYSQPKLEKIVHTLFEYDLKSKGVNVASVNGGELLREMVFKILH